MTDDSGQPAVTGSGEEYTASTDDGTASIEYLGASLDINEGEFVEDEDGGGTFFCLRMTYWNDLGSPQSEMDDIEEKDCLTASFVIQAVQDGKVIDYRDEVDAETFEEEASFEYIEQGETAECELYFPVDGSRPVTIQVLNPDGEDTVMAELEFSPEE